MIKALLNIAQISNNTEWDPRPSRGNHSTGEYADGTVGPSYQVKLFSFF